jgi:hypothetical protein
MGIFWDIIECINRVYQQIFGSYIIILLLQFEEFSLDRQMSSDATDFCLWLFECLVFVLALD